MLETMQAYFAGEKAESLLFIGAGLLAICAGIAFLFRRGFLRGMAGPLIAVACIHLVVGGSVYLRTDAQLATLAQQLHEDPAAWQRQEAQRMAVVNANFDLYRRIEIGLTATGLALLLFGLARARPWIAGLGTGLALQAAFTLLLDYFAEARADVYTAAILALGT